jgi:beta-galactosidase GanA
MNKNQGVNTIQIYEFLNIHEQKLDVLDFSGRANLSRFLKEAANASLFVNFRIVPYVCGEWNSEIANISIRSSNDAWKS